MNGSQTQDKPAHLSLSKSTKISTNTETAMLSVDSTHQKLHLLNFFLTNLVEEKHDFSKNYEVIWGGKMTKTQSSQAGMLFSRNWDAMAINLSGSH